MGTLWAKRVLGAGMSLQGAMRQAKERARLECDVSVLTFPLHPSDQPPKPSGENVRGQADPCASGNIRALAPLEFKVQENPGRATRISSLND
jgi:hypothetical protein